MILSWFGLRGRSSLPSIMNVSLDGNPYNIWHKHILWSIWNSWAYKPSGGRSAELCCLPVIWFVLSVIKQNTVHSASLTTDVFPSLPLAWLWLSCHGNVLHDRMSIFLSSLLSAGLMKWTKLNDSVLVLVVEYFFPFGGTKKLFF